MPRFSILMANYNMAKYIPDAIKSILAQTFKDWELIIVDDKSTDNSLKIIDRYIKDKRIHVIKRSTNGGYGKTLNTAIKHSAGEIICIVDSDDALKYKALQIVNKAYVNNPDVGFVYTQYKKCNSKLKPYAIGGCASIPDGQTYIYRVVHNLKPKYRISHLKTFRRTAYDKTEGFTKAKRTVDKDIVFKLELVTKMLFIPKVTYLHRKHTGSITFRMKKQVRTIKKKIMEKAIQRARKKGINV